MNDMNKPPSRSELPQQRTRTEEGVDREEFMRLLILDLAGTLENLVGLDHASGFINAVGRRMGERLQAHYQKLHGKERFTVEEVGEILVDLKHHIGGTFEIVEQDEERIVFHNGHCPFGAEVKGRESLCMMTSNVFGSITADNHGYARVELLETISRGDGRCLVQVNLRRDGAVDHDGTREYFQLGESPD